MRFGQLFTNRNRSAMAQVAASARGLCKEAVVDAWPTYCQCASQEDDWQIDPPGRYCWRCGISMGRGGVTEAGCAFCVGKSIGWNRLVRLGPYAQPMNHWIVSMKFAHAWAWARWFGQALAQVIDREVQSGPVGVCPVPMYWARRMHRGYNQSQLMAAALASRRCWPLLSLLRRTRYTLPQTAVPPSLRAANIRKSFSIEPVDLSGWHIWLIDDVKTTGSTLAACAKLLRRAGAARVDAAVAAVAYPHGAVHPGRD